LVVGAAAVILFARAGGSPSKRRAAALRARVASVALVNKATRAAG
jgi:hypothetical protein